MRPRRRSPGWTAAGTVALASAAAVGCAGAATSGLQVVAAERGAPGASSGRGYLFELAASADAAWAELPGVYEALGVPLSFVDGERRQLGNGGWSLPRRLDGQRPSYWVDCGRGIDAAPNADVYDVVMTIRSGVQPTGSGSAVETAVEGSAGPSDASGGVVSCASRGTIERRIGELLRDRLAEKGR